MPQSRTWKIAGRIFVRGKCAYRRSHALQYMRTARLPVSSPLARMAEEASAA